MLVEVGPDTVNCEEDVATPLTVNVVLPALVRVTAFGALEVTGATVPNAIEVGETPACAAAVTPVPLSATTGIAVVALLANVRVPE
jgi:hypothetical protein